MGTLRRNWNVCGCFEPRCGMCKASSRSKGLGGCEGEDCLKTGLDASPWDFQRSGNEACLRRQGMATQNVRNLEWTRKELLCI
jgi:hypothetical protein